MTKFNVAILLLLTGVLLAAVSGQTKQTQSTNQVGRYQLFSGEGHLIGSTLPEKFILRIDTQTGNVDEWIVGEKKDGKIINLWGRTGLDH